MKSDENSIILFKDKDIGMNIGLNLLHARPEIGGGWNYIKNIVDTLAEFDNNNQYFCYCTPASECLVPHKSNFQKVLHKKIFKSQITRVLFENTIFQFYIKRDQIDIVYWFANVRSLISRTKSIVTVYDLGAFGIHKKKTFVDILRQFYLYIIFPLTCKNATVIAPMSKSTEDALVKKFGVKKEKCVIIPNSLAPVFEPAGDDIICSFKERFSLPENFWLYVAHYYPHKNHLGLFEAYRLYQERTSGVWPLVLRGEKNGADLILEKTIRVAGIQDNIIWLPKLDVKDMQALYSSATALVFPSLFEGGGIPVMEAMACGCPVVASDIPPTREFAADAALYFNPNDVNDIAEKMLSFQKNDFLRNNHRKIGFEKVENLTRESVFFKIKLAYQKAMF